MKLSKLEAVEAQVAELVYALAWGASSRKGLEVQVLSWAQGKEAGLLEREPAFFFIRYRLQ